MQDPSSRRFALIGAFLAAFISLLPFLVASTVLRPEGSTYLGYQTATDDAMVYSAWVRQAMDGHVLFDNRFTNSPQPAQTIHLWFLLLGLIAKGVGLTLTFALTRAFCSGLFVWLAYQLLRRVVYDNYLEKMGLVIVALGGGVGFIHWQNFGQAFDPPTTLGLLTNQGLPIDIWQTEAFAMPSMLVNGLFMVSLCLILGIFIQVLDAKSSPAAVWKGAACFLVLMNIHSYDVLLVAMTLVGLLLTQLVSGTLEKPWVGRVFLMGCGAIPPALWFLHVLQSDPVFRARAAVPTLEASFNQVILGLFWLMILGLIGLSAIGKGPRQNRWTSDKPLLGSVLALASILVLGALGMAHKDGNSMVYGMGGFLAIAALMYGVIALNASGESGKDLTVSWALIGLVAPYVPFAFQRKLAMGLEVPWAILATFGLGAVVMSKERGTRNLVTTFCLILMGASSFYWIQRELTFAKRNVSSTTVQPVYLSPSLSAIIDYLNKNKGPQDVVLAMPGIARGDGTPASFSTPYLADANPLVSGLTGAYTYAGHWGETPDYGKARARATSAFLESMPDSDRRAFFAQERITYVLAPQAAAFADFGELSQGQHLADLRPYGDVVVEGTQFYLVKIRL